MSFKIWMWHRVSSSTIFDWQFKPELPIWNKRRKRKKIQIDGAILLLFKSMKHSHSSMIRLLLCYILSTSDSPSLSMGAYLRTRWNLKFFFIIKLKLIINIAIMIVFVLWVQGILSSINCLKPKGLYFFQEIFKMPNWIALYCILSPSLFILLIPFLLTIAHSEMNKTTFLFEYFLQSV